MPTKRNHETITHVTPTARLQQQSLKFEDDIELWHQLPESSRHDVVGLVQQMLIQWCDRDSEGGQS